jgi:hypothetical protein
MCGDVWTLDWAEKLNLDIDGIFLRVDTEAREVTESMFVVK